MAVSDKKERSVPILILVFIILSAGIITIGYLYYRNHEKHYRTEVERQLSAIAEMKADELAGWRKERLGDAYVFYKNDNFSARVRQYLKTPGDPEARIRLRTWLRQFHAGYEYERIFLLDNNGVERMSVPDKPEPVAHHLLEHLSEIMRSRQVTFLDFHRDRPDQPIHLAVLVPVLDGRESRRVIGLLVFRIDPQKYLYPFINRWPTLSKTAETLIVRRDGNDVLFLNELKFKKNTALNLRIPLEKTETPAVQAVLGRQGIVEGKDYRGVPVIASIRAVPDSPWFLVARMDISEAYAPMRERLWIMVILVGALLIGAGAGVGLLWRHQIARFYLEKYEASEALLAISLRQEAILSAVPDIIMEVDRNKVYTWANQAGKEFFGEDVIGREAAFYFEGEQETYKTVKPLFNGNENVIYIESWQRRKNGEKRLLAWWCRVLKDNSGNVTGALSTAHDITESRLAEKEIIIRNKITSIFLTSNTDEEMYNEVLSVVLEVMESRYGVVGYIDEDGALVVPSMSRHIWDKCRVPDKTFIFERDKWGHSSWSRAIREKKSNYTNEPSNLTPEGHIPVIRHISMPIIFQGEVIGLIQVANKETDYTEKDLRLLELLGNTIMAPILNARLQRDTQEKARKQAEEEIYRLNEELEQRVLERTTQLEASNKELEAFSYSVSHDLRAPLRAIEGYSRFILEDYMEKLDDEGKRLLNIIRTNTQKMDQLITDILALSRVSRTEMKLSRIDMTTLVNSIYHESALPEIQEKFVFSVSTLPDAFGDPTLIRQVWANLISNAVKYTLPKEERRIEIGGRVESGINIYYIKDTGVGFNPDYTHKLFGLFQRLHKAEEFEGTGVGLAIVQRIVLRHGGKVWAEGKENEGATFRFSMPIKTVMSGEC